MQIFSVVEVVTQDNHARYEITDNYGNITVVYEHDLASYQATGSPNTDAIASLAIWLQSNDAVIFYDVTPDPTPDPEPEPEPDDEEPTPAPGDGSLHLPDLALDTGTPSVQGLVLAHAMVETSSVNIGDDSEKVVVQVAIKIINSYSSGSILIAGKTIDLAGYVSGDLITVFPFVDQNQVTAQMVGAVGGQCRVFIQYQ